MSQKNGPFLPLTVALEAPGRWTFQDASGHADCADGALALVVADGHGPSGKLASGIAVSAIIEGVRDADVDADWIRRRFLDAHRRIVDHEEKGDGGTTATFVHVRHDRLLCGWVGNSEARIVKADGKLRTLTIPHEFGLHRQETARLIRAGASIASRRSAVTYGLSDDREGSRPKRGYVQVDRACLEVSRALGDEEFDPFVLHEPEVKEVAISSDDRYLIVASDGFWHVTCKRATKRRVVEELLAGSSDVADARGKLAAYLSHRKLNDDTTFVIVAL